MELRLTQRKPGAKRFREELSLSIHHCCAIGFTISNHLDKQVEPTQAFLRVLIISLGKMFRAAASSVAASNCQHSEKAVC
jgi:hypothetical protein